MCFRLNAGSHKNALKSAVTQATILAIQRPPRLPLYIGKEIDFCCYWLQYLKICYKHANLSRNYVPCIDHNPCVGVI